MYHFDQKKAPCSSGVLVGRLSKNPYRGGGDNGFVLVFVIYELSMQYSFMNFAFRSYVGVSWNINSVCKLSFMTCAFKHLLSLSTFASAFWCSGQIKISVSIFIESKLVCISNFMNRYFIIRGRRSFVIYEMCLYNSSCMNYTLISSIFEYLHTFTGSLCLYRKIRHFPLYRGMYLPILIYELRLQILNFLIYTVTIDRNGPPWIRVKSGARPEHPPPSLNKQIFSLFLGNLSFNWKKQG